MIINRIQNGLSFYSRWNDKTRLVELSLTANPDRHPPFMPDPWELTAGQAKELAVTMRRLADAIEEDERRKDYPLPPIDMEFEASVTQWRIVLGKNPSLVSTKEFGEWAVKHVKALAVMATGYANDTANVRRARMAKLEERE